MAKTPADKGDVPSLDDIMSTPGWDNRVALARARRQRVLAEREASPPTPPRNPLRDAPVIATPVATSVPEPQDESDPAPVVATPFESAPQEPQERRSPVLILLAFAAVCAIGIGTYLWQFSPAQPTPSDATVSPAGLAATPPGVTPSVDDNLAIPREVARDFLQPGPESSPPQAAPVLPLNGSAPLASAPNLQSQITLESANQIQPVSRDIQWPEIAPVASQDSPAWVANAIVDGVPQITRRALVEVLSSLAPLRAPSSEDNTLDMPQFADTVELARAGTAQLAAVDPVALASVTSFAPPEDVSVQRVLTSLAQTSDTKPPTRPAGITTPPSTTTIAAITPAVTDPAPLRPVDVSPPLARPGAGLEVRILTPASATRQEIDLARQALAELGSTDGGTRSIDYTVRDSHLRFYHTPDQASAEELARALGIEARDMRSVSSGPAPGLLEFWMSGRSTSPQTPPPNRSAASPPTPQSEGTCARQSGRTIVRVPIRNGRCQW